MLRLVHTEYADSGFTCAPLLFPLLAMREAFVANPEETLRYSTSSPFRELN